MAQTDPTTLFVEKGKQAVCSSSNYIQFGNMASHKRTGEKTKKCTKTNREENAGRYDGGQKASNMDTKTNKG